MCDELDYVSEKIVKCKGTWSIAFMTQIGECTKRSRIKWSFIKINKWKNWPSYIEISTPKNKKQQIFDIDKNWNTEFKWFSSTIYE